MDGWVDWRMDVRMCGWMEEQGWKSGWVDGWVGGGVEEWRSGGVEE